MDQFIAKAVEVLFGYGLPGLIICYLIWERKVLQDNSKELMEALTNSQEKRIQEARETTSALEVIKDTLETLRDFMRGGGRNHGRGDNV